MTEHVTDQWISHQAKKCLARMDASVRKAVDSLISDPRFVTYDDHVTLLLAIAETCYTKEEALALFKGAVQCIEHGDLPVGRRVRLAHQTGPSAAEGPSSERSVSDTSNPTPVSAISMSDVLNPVSLDQDWQFLWSLLGDRAFCEKYWNQYVAVFMKEVVGNGPTDPEARGAAARTLTQRGTRDVPLERFVVDFVGHA